MSRGEVDYLSFLGEEGWNSLRARRNTAQLTKYSLVQRIEVETGRTGRNYKKFEQAMFNLALSWTYLHEWNKSHTLLKKCNSKAVAM